MPATGHCLFPSRVVCQSRRWHCSACAASTKPSALQLWQRFSLADVHTQRGIAPTSCLLLRLPPASRWCIANASDVPGLCGAPSHWVTAPSTSPLHSVRLPLGIWCAGDANRMVWWARRATRGWGMIAAAEIYDACLPLHDGRLACLFSPLPSVAQGTPRNRPLAPTSDWMEEDQVTLGGRRKMHARWRGRQRRRRAVHSLPLPFVLALIICQLWVRESTLSLASPC
jgi:hypothetical protein